MRKVLVRQLHQYLQISLVQLVADYIDYSGLFWVPREEDDGKLLLCSRDGLYCNIAVPPLSSSVVLQANEGHYVVLFSEPGARCLISMTYNNENRRILFRTCDISGIRPVHGATNLILVIQFMRGARSRINIANVATGVSSCGFGLLQSVDVKNVVSFLDVTNGALRVAIVWGLDICIYTHKKTTFYLQDTIDLTDRHVNAVQLLWVGSGILVIHCNNAVLTYSASHPFRYLDEFVFTDLNFYIPIVEPIIVDRTIYMLAICKTDNRWFWIRWKPTVGFSIGEKKRTGSISDKQPHCCVAAGPFLAEFYPDQNRIDMTRQDNLCFSHSIYLEKNLV
jgi:hypothetical protein